MEPTSHAGSGGTPSQGPERRDQRAMWREGAEFKRKARDLRTRAQAPDSDGIHPAVDRLIDTPWLRQAINGDHAAQLSFLVANSMWDGLTRTLDAQGLRRVLTDEKVSEGTQRVYVPSTDATGLRYFRMLAEEVSGLEVQQLPTKVTPEFVKRLDEKPGILSLGLRPTTNIDGGVLASMEGVPYVVPGGRFNEMYGWDSHFIVLGLLEDKRRDLAKSIVDNQVYQVEHYGKVLNANRSYYLTRSQPPFLAVTALAVYEEMEKTPENKAWLARALGAAIREYQNVWNAPDHVTDSTGLTRYFGRGTGMPIEVEEGHYDSILLELASQRRDPWADGRCKIERTFSLSQLRKLAVSGKFSDMEEYFVHDRAMRESGFDTTYRFRGTCADLNPVCLNSLLYRMESDIARAIHEVFEGTLRTPGLPEQTTDEWSRRAYRRAESMREHMWSAKDGMFHDVNHTTGEQVPYLNAAGVYPLWAGLARDREAEAIVNSVVLPLEYKGGLVSGCPDALAERREKGDLGANGPLGQWDFPFGWAPQQMIAWEGLDRYGYHEQAEELAYRWIHMMVVDALAHGGSIVEKYDVHNRTRETPEAEYGNVGKDEAIYTGAGFGWTNAALQQGLRYLSAQRRRSLKALELPFDIGWDAAGPELRGTWH